MVLILDLCGIRFIFQHLFFEDLNQNTMQEQFNEWSHQILPWLLTHGLKILGISIAAYILNYISRRFIDKVVRVTVTRDHHDSEVSERKREDTLIRIFTWTVSIVILLVALMMVLQEMGVPIGPMLAGAGIVGLAVGFGGQYLIRDLITGFFMILENQYRIGDVVSLDNTSGLVEDISLRMTTLRDMNGTVHHVPHGDIKRVANQSKNFARINLNINIAYNANLERAIELLNQVGSALAEDPIYKEFITKAPQFLRVEDFTETAVKVKVLGETLPLKQWEITGELRRRIKIAFDQEGIDILFPQRVFPPFANRE
jgi:small conductance mechanosensitive channel